MYDPRFDGAVLRNGDRATGEWNDEDGRRWYRAIDAQTGNEYETEEKPCVIE